MKTLKEVYNFNSKNKPKIVKVLEKARRLIEAEEAAPAEEAKSVGKIGDKPRGDSVDKATNVKDVDPIEMANQLLSGDDDAPLVASTKGEWFQTSGAEAKAWIEDLGPETFVQRLQALAIKVPKTGLPKSVMPFLPGPKDAQGEFVDVEDALSPGGKYNVDTHEESGTGETEEKTKDKNESLVRGAEYMLTEKSPPPAANTFLGMDGGGEEFMKAGLKDGDPQDDTITVTKGGTLAAADAKPTQSNILIFKGLGMAMNPANKISGGDLGAWAGINGEILDGHHRWAATMFNDPTASMGLAGQVDLQGLGGGNEQEVLKYLTAIGNALGNKTKVPKKESRVRNNKDKLIMERWNKLAGLLND